MLLLVCVVSSRSSWGILGSCYDKWLSLETWTFWGSCYETLDVKQIYLSRALPTLLPQRKGSSALHWCQLWREVHDSHSASRDSRSWSGGLLVAARLGWEFRLPMGLCWHLPGWEVEGVSCCSLQSLHWLCRGGGPVTTGGSEKSWLSTRP